MTTQQILTTLTNMMKSVAIIHEGDYSQKQKDDSKRIMNESLDYANQELDGTELRRLLYVELKRKKIDSLK